VIPATIAPRRRIECRALNVQLPIPKSPPSGAEAAGEPSSAVTWPSNLGIESSAFELRVRVFSQFAALPNESHPEPAWT
jgi:hypothetical protein